MEVRLLGPVGLWLADREIVLPRAQQRCVLAMLATNPRRIIPVRTLIDGVWGDRPPDSAIHSLHSHVSRLRQVLSRAGGGQVRRRGDGYLLEVGRDQVDLHRSRQLVAQALRTPGGGRERDTQVASRLREACGL
jgi:DNA-binding SARP family transcriptional activator